MFTLFLLKRPQKMAFAVLFPPPKKKGEKEIKGEEFEDNRKQRFRKLYCQNLVSVFFVFNPFFIEFI